MHNAYYIYCAKMKLQHIYANFVVVVVIVNVVTSFSPFSLSLSLSPAFSLFLLLIQCVFFFACLSLACYFGPVFVPVQSAVIYVNFSSASVASQGSRWREERGRQCRDLGSLGYCLDRPQSMQTETERERTRAALRVHICYAL